MSYSPAAIANYFLDKASEDGRALTPMQLLKLVYIAHGWHLGFRDEPLINEPVQAWQYGPVIRSLYNEVRHYGGSAVTAPLRTSSMPWAGTASVEDPEVARLLDNVWSGYGHFGGIKLSEMTHMEGSPWWRTWNEEGGSSKRDAVIRDDVIRKFYKRKISAHRKGLYDRATADRAQRKRWDSEASAVRESDT